jgi:V8-like Glu-specific endopeptidase
MTGAPLYIYDTKLLDAFDNRASFLETEKLLIGIHNGFHMNSGFKKLNYGTLITPDVDKWIKASLSEYLEAKKPGGKALKT